MSDLYIHAVIVFVMFQDDVKVASLIFANQATLVFPFYNDPTQVVNSFHALK